MAKRAATLPAASVVRAIAFDFDGVLVESVDVKTRAFARLFAGEPPAVVEQIVAFHLRHGGVSRFEKFRAIYRDILRRPLDDRTLWAMGERFAALVVDEVVAAPWVEGAREFLARHAVRYEFFVVSGTPEEELKEILRRRQVTALFRGAFGSPRTKDVLLREVLRQAGLRRRELLFVGDADTDWAAARAVGVPFIRRRTPLTAEPDGFPGARISSLHELDACLGGGG